MSTHLVFKSYFHAAFLLGTTIFSTSALATPTTEDWRTFNHEMLEHHVVPRYHALEVSAEKLKLSSAALCQNIDQAQLEKARNAFHHTMDAWQSIQHIRSGPIEMMMRNYSMQFWPDKKNHVGKHLDKLIADKDSKSLTTDDFYSITVAVRGLPAIERLLFDPAALKELQNDAFRCQVLERISAYVDEMSQAVTSEWQKDMVTEFANAGKSEDSLYESPEEVAVTLLKPIIENIEIIKELKILRVLGSQLDMVKPKRLESWRSERSLTNIQLNIAAVKAIYEGENGSASSLRQLITEGERTQIDELFAVVEAPLAAFEQPMETLVTTQQGYQAFSDLAVDLERLLKATEAAISNNGIFLGFNSRDGD